MPYKNNTVLVSCYKSLGQCFAFEVDDIGLHTTGHIPLPVIFSITRWEPSLVVATTGGYPRDCVRQTVNLARDRDKKVSVEFVEEPINQAKKICQNTPNVVRKWTLENPACSKKLTNKGQ